MGQTVQDELALLGAPDEVLEAQQRDTESFEVHPRNHGAVEWFCEVADLMRYQNGVCLGLDLPQVQADSQLRGRPCCPDSYQRLRQMARAAADRLNERLP